MGKEVNKLFSIIETLKSMTPSNFGLMLDIGTKLASTDASAWATAFKAQLKAGVTNTLAPATAQPFGEQCTLMQLVYDKYFADMNTAVPQYEDLDGHVTMHIAAGLTCDAIYAAYPFPKWKWMSGSIDVSLDKNFERRPEGSYQSRVKNGVEPDAQHLGKSTSQADPNGSIGITLLERMMLELVHFEQTGKHLDIRGVTFCSGSRYRGGYAPDVCLGDDGVCVGRYRQGGSSNAGGVREAVSL